MKMLFVFFFLILMSSGCKKRQENKLPPATQSGANTFGCLIDGKAWVPTGRGVGSGIYPTSGGFFRDVTGMLNVYVKAYSNHDYFHIYLKNGISSGAYYLNKNTPVRPNSILPESYGAYFVDGQDYYVTNSSNMGTVKITYADTTQGIVSGTFEMKLYSKVQEKQ
jgi:hypothetical protein